MLSGQSTASLGELHGGGRHCQLFQGGDTTHTNLLTLEREPMTEESNHHNEVYLGDPVSLQWSYELECR